MYLAGYESFADVTSRLPKFVEEVYNAGACTRRLVASHQTSLKLNSPDRRLDSDEAVVQPEGFTPTKAHGDPTKLIRD